MDGALVVDLCERGDQMILEETKKVYKKEKEMKKGRRNERGAVEDQAKGDKVILLYKINTNLFA